ncbi:MAG: hypothetical protein R3C99_21695, partial [Pirellulaceae bacterium]
MTETDAVIEDAEPHVDTERFLLLLPDGPLVIDLRMTIDGQSHVVVFDRLVDEVAALADTDGDGRATWAEVIDSPRFKYGQLGNIAVNTPNERQQVLQLYDIDNDGLFDRNEIPRFLTRNAGGSRPFSLTSSNEYRRANRYQSPLLGWLDTDGDGALAADECEAAAARLRTRDSNEDELLAASDFRETSNQAMAMISGRRRVSEPDTAFLISSRVDWGSLLFSLEETYSFRDRIRSDAFDRKDGLFTAVDENRDGVWQVDELPNLLAVPPHLLFAADFGKPAEPPATDTDSAETDSTAADAESTSDETPEATADAAGSEIGRPSLRLLERHASLGDSEATVVTYVGRIVLRLPDATVEFFVNDMLAANDGRAAAMAQFNQLDADSNGYLDTDEYSDEAPPLQVPFAALDADGDGKAYLAEVEALLRQRQGAIRSQIRGRAADQEDALFTALDSDGDGRLNRRETELAGKVIQAMDGNQDGRVTPGEIQTSFVVGLVRGDPQQGNNLFVMPPPRRLTATDAPAWFTNMDANNDGFVS